MQKQSTANQLKKKAASTKRPGFAPLHWMLLLTLCHLYFRFTVVYLFAPQHIYIYIPVFYLCVDIQLSFILRMQSKTREEKKEAKEKKKLKFVHHISAQRIYKLHQFECANVVL